jgi:putative ABC transport system ATP-binding protein
MAEGHDPLSPPAVELVDVRKAYREGERERRVFDRLSLRVPRGRLTVLFGRSGTGKSTLLNLVSGIDLPDEGEVLLDGVSLTRRPERERTLYRRRHIGFVFQFFNLIPTLTVRENLLLPLQLVGARGAPAEAAVARHLKAVGLADRRDSFPDRLSGGEQQRVAIARALVHDPRLVLADEPTGNLDVETGRGVLELLARLTREAGRTLLMVTHSAEAEAYADRVLHLAGGGVTEAPGSVQGRAPEQGRCVQVD